MSKARVRFAPSPTGHLHLGGARTALINYVFTKSQDGQFVLRIEDTDQERSRPEFEIYICAALKKCGIQWDEGPDIPGEYGPYKQSERIDLYQKYCNQLLESGLAYYCFFTDDELSQMRDEATAKRKTFRIPPTYKKLTKEEVAKLISEGRPYTIRLDVQKRQSSYSFKDLLKQDVTLPSHMVDDFVIFRSNGFPTYNFAAAIDDTLMKISHVIRGEEHLSNTLRQLMVYDSLDFKPPAFLHLPLIMGKDEHGKVTKLSKRHGEVSVTSFFEKGVLPEAFVNYLLSLGYSHAEGVEFFSINDVIQSFSIKGLSKSAALWDPLKLAWYNGQYIEKLSDEVYLQHAKPYLIPPYVPQSFVDMISEFEPCILYYKGHISQFDELPSLLKMFFDPDANPEENGEVKTFLSGEERMPSFEKVVKALSHYFDTAQKVSWNELMTHVKEATGLKGKNLFMSMRIALTNAVHGPELAKLIEQVPINWINKRLHFLSHWIESKK